MKVSTFWNKSKSQLVERLVAEIYRNLTELEDRFGWEHLGYLIPINCFNSDPSVKSSLKFLRKTPWARKKVEDLYIEKIIKL